MMSFNNVPLVEKSHSGYHKLLQTKCYDILVHFLYIDNFILKSHNSHILPLRCHNLVFKWPFTTIITFDVIYFIEKLPQTINYMQVTYCPLLYYISDFYMTLTYC